MNDSEKLQAIRAILDGAPAVQSAPVGFSTAGQAVTLERGASADFPAGVTAAVAVHHPGGVLELKVEAQRGQGFFTELTEQMVGPVGFEQRTVAPSGTTSQHTVVAEDRPMGTYTYYVAASCPLRVFRVQ